MRCKFIFPILFCAALSACTPPPPKVDESKNVNAGVNIVPQAMLAAEEQPPDMTDPAVGSRPNLVQAIASSDQNHEIFLKALRLSGMVPELQKAGPFTVFAPTDEAFAKLPPGALDRLFLPAALPQLRDLVQRHIINGRLPLKSLLDTNGQIPTSAGDPVIIRGIDSKVMVNDANITRADNSASNGVIYWLDGVLLPPM